MTNQQFEFSRYDLDLYLTLTIKVKLLNLTKFDIMLLFMDRFDSYFDKTTLDDKTNLMNT